MAASSEVAFRVAASLGASLVALGAFGAHGLKDILEANDTAAIWQTAVFYHAIHTVALLALALAARASRILTGLWLGGVIVFSGSLYLLAVTDIRWLGAITPIGGVALLAGWIVVLFSRR